MIGLHVSKKEVFILGAYYFYGSYYGTMSAKNLETGKMRSLRHLVLSDKKGQPWSSVSGRFGTSIAGCLDGGFCLAAYRDIFRLDAEGRVVGQATKALGNHRELVGVWKGRAVVVEPRGIDLVPLEPAKLTTTKKVSSTNG